MNRDIPSSEAAVAARAEPDVSAKAAVSAEAGVAVGTAVAAGAEAAGGGGQRGRPRSQEADRAILTATLDLLGSRGLAAMSIEEVAARAGVGKATIYRRWSSQGQLA